MSNDSEDTQDVGVGAPRISQNVNKMTSGSCVSFASPYETLAQYAKPWIVNIEDITPFVREQHLAFQRGGTSALVTPREDVYPCEATTAQQLGIDSE